MKKLTIIFSSAFLFFASCGEVKESKRDNNNSESNTEITGTYVLEGTYEVKNMSTGKVVGNETIRDTIFIKKKEKGYEVKNSKFKFNDYDQFGWRSIGGTRKLPTFQATYDKSDTSLIPIQNQFVSPIYLDLKNELLYKDSGKTQPYKKIK